MNYYDIYKAPMYTKEEIVSVKSLPPIYWSLCKSITLANCTTEENFLVSNLFYDDYYYDYSDDNGNSYYFTIYKESMKSPKIIFQKVYIFDIH